MSRKIICIHIGARAHYLLPKALQSKNILEALITDTWVSSRFLRSILTKAPVRILKSFSGRFSSTISSSLVLSFSMQFLLIELFLRFKYKGNWDLIINRNIWFQRLAIGKFKKLRAESAVLGISYTSLDLFNLARQRGQKTILFQIDPGYKEEQIVSDIVTKYGSVFTTSWMAAPATYWEIWLKECELSDVIMVNSEWSKSGLVEQGISSEKIVIIPLPFQLEFKHRHHVRQYPEVFSPERPLRLLFLGTLTLRKGIHLVLKAAEMLIDQPIEFILVGENELDETLLQAGNVKYQGVASRGETDAYYQYADVFLFPTLSDGFGLTQLEAMSWQLPVIASKACGEVVVNGFNGLVLDTCDADQLITAISKCLNDISLLEKLSSNGIKTVEQFSTDQFAESLMNLI